MPVIAAVISLALETGSTASRRIRSKASSNRLSSSYTVSLSTNWALAGPLPACGAGFGWAFAWAKAGGIPSAIIRIAAASPRIPLNLRKSAPAGCRLSPKTLCEESRHYHGRPHRASFFFAFPFGRENVADLADPAGRAALQLGAELVVRHQPGVRLEHLGRSRAGGEDVENRSVLERAADGEDLARGGGTGRWSFLHRDGLCVGGSRKYGLSRRGVRSAAGRARRRRSPFSSTGSAASGCAVSSRRPARCARTISSRPPAVKCDRAHRRLAQDGPRPHTRARPAP